MAYFLLEHLTEKYYCRNYMNRQNAKKFHLVGSTTFDMQVTRSEVDRRTVEPRLTTTPFIRTPPYYGHILSNQK